MKIVVSRVAWSALLALSIGCRSADAVEPRTEVLLQIDAERLVKLAAERLVVEITSGPKDGDLTSAGATEEFDVTADDFNWPAGLALVAKPGHEVNAFEIAINIEQKGKRVARSRVKSTFIKHQTLLLKTLLYGECLGNLDCSGNQTCVAPDGKARCDNAEIDASTLPQYVSEGSAGAPAANGGRAGSSNPSGGAGGGAAGKGGTGGGDGPEAGSGGGGGQAGSKDAGMTGGGGAPACESLGAEKCDNGIDDDCNGKLDCADPACDSMQCVPNGTVVGVLVPETAACPSGYDKGEQLVHKGLMDQGCGGCGCVAAPTMCTPTAYFYATAAACTTDLAPYSAGKQVMAAIPPKPGCSTAPIGASIGIENPTAWRVKVTKSVDACSSNGTASPMPPTWSNTVKLCAATAKRNGCDSGYACVPKPETGKICMQRDVVGCPASTTLQTWQRGFTDERSCGTCGCAAQGGSCSEIVVNMGHDYSCGNVDSSLHDGEKACVVSTYYPPAFWEGAPKNPMCSAGAQVMGALKPSMPLDLCCLD